MTRYRERTFGEKSPKHMGPLISSGFTVYEDHVQARSRRDENLVGMIQAIGALNQTC